MSKSHEMPERFARIAESVKAKDRQYFFDHPTQIEYVRQYVPGEAWPCQPECDLVTVIKVTPDCRHKIFHDRPGAKQTGNVKLIISFPNEPTKKGRAG